MVVMKMFSLLTLLLISHYRSIQGIRAHVEEENAEAELERRLKILNKPPVETFQFDYAIFDCIDIYKQPAFDNPLLKNHKIQLEPIQLSVGVKKEHLLLSGFGIFPECPNGTVPIRRTTKEDLVREKYLVPVHHYYPNTDQPKQNSHYAIMNIIHKDKEFSGGKANLDIRNPQCKNGETSGAQIWLFNLHREIVGDGVSAGWMVNPTFYKDDARTFLTAMWIGNDKDGCINIRCPGFIQTNPTIPLGLLLPNISQNGGPLFKLAISISQDRSTGNWWLGVKLEGDEVKVGYWPKEIFYSLDEGAKTLSYGGYVRAMPDQPTPPMGSGLSEQCNYDHTAFIGNMEYTLRGNDKFLQPMYSTTEKHTDCSNYQVFDPCKEVKGFGFYLLYGGPRATCT